MKNGRISAVWLKAFRTTDGTPFNVLSFALPKGSLASFTSYPESMDINMHDLDADDLRAIIKACEEGLCTGQSTSTPATSPAAV